MAVPLMITLTESGSLLFIFLVSHEQQQRKITEKETDLKSGGELQSPKLAPSKKCSEGKFFVEVLLREEATGC